MILSFSKVFQGEILKIVFLTMLILLSPFFVHRHGIAQEGQFVEDPEVSLDTEESRYTQDSGPSEEEAVQPAGQIPEETDEFLEEEIEEDMDKDVQVTDLSEMGVDTDNWLSAIDGEEGGISIEEIAEP